MQARALWELGFGSTGSVLLQRLHERDEDGNGVESEDDEEDAIEAGGTRGGAAGAARCTLDLFLAAHPRRVTAETAQRSLREWGFAQACGLCDYSCDL